MPPQDISSYNGLFLKTAKEHIDIISNNLDALKDISDKQNVYEEIYRRAHSLKGSSSVMGHREITETCTEIVTLVHPLIEASISDEKLNHLSSLVLNLKRQIDEVEKISN